MLEKQFLLNPDGSYPNGMTKQVLDTLGLIPVIPSEYPKNIEEGYTVVEVDPILENDVYVQQWKIVEDVKSDQV